MKGSFVAFIANLSDNKPSSFTKNFCFAQTPWVGLTKQYYWTKRLFEERLGRNIWGQKFSRNFPPKEN